MSHRSGLFKWVTIALPHKDSRKSEAIRSAQEWELDAKRQSDSRSEARSLEKAGSLWLVARKPERAVRAYKSAAIAYQQFSSHPYIASLELSEAYKTKATTLLRKVERLEQLAKGHWKGLAANSAVIAGLLSTALVVSVFS